MKRIPKKTIPKKTNRFPVGMTRENWCATTAGIGFGCIDGEIYINAQFDDKKSLLNWCKHELLMMRSVAERLEYFIQLAEKKDEGNE